MPLSSPLPTAAPASGPSAAAQHARAYISQRDGIPIEALAIDYDSQTEYPALGRQFQVVTLVNTRQPGHAYKLLVDLQDGRVIENISALLKAEERAYREKYGRMEPALHERLAGLQDEDTLAVAIWVASSPGNSLSEREVTARATLAAKYPEARAAVDQGGKPMDVSDPELRERIEADYAALMAVEPTTRIGPLVMELRQRGFAIVTYEGMPTFSAVLPKRVILELAERPEVGAIYLTEAQVVLE